MRVPMYTRSSDIKTLLLDGCPASWLLGHLYKDQLPDTTWFILGTAIHEAIEWSILEEVSDLDDIIAYGYMQMMVAIGESKNGIMEPGKRGSRSKATMKDDLERILEKWFNLAHPEGEMQHPTFKSYDWPPTVEHQINIGEGENHLITTVDAIFQGGRFGEETGIIDWKTGASKTAAESQLYTYYYGGSKEGWLDPKETDIYVGRFWHCDHAKEQVVRNYPGDEVVERWIRATHQKKLDTFENPVFNPRFLCNYCPARGFCPIYSDNTFAEVSIQIEKIEQTYEPTEKDG